MMTLYFFNLLIKIFGLSHRSLNNNKSVTQKCKSFFIYYFRESIVSLEKTAGDKIPLGDSPWRKDYY